MSLPLTEQISSCIGPLPLQELAFRMPFHLYNDKSFVVWGNKDFLDAGDQRHGAPLFILTFSLATFSQKSNVPFNPAVHVDSITHGGNRRGESARRN